MDQLDEDTADEAEAVHNALGVGHVVEKKARAGSLSGPVEIFHRAASV